MGTNYYFFTQNKKYKDMSNDFELVDEPDFGYLLHVAKTSGGWLPLFEAHENMVHCLKDYENLYRSGNFKILDEYDRELNWDEFYNVVVKHNGGTKLNSTRSTEKINYGSKSDPVIIYAPASHIDFNTEAARMGTYHSMACYYKDPEGFEFFAGEFS